MAYDDLRLLSTRSARSDPRPVHHELARISVALKPLVFLFDDNASLMRQAELILTGEGFRVMLGSGRDDSMAVLRDEKPDIAVIDVWSTDEPCPGWRLVEHLAGSNEYRTLPIVVSTDDSQLEATVWERLNGCSRVLRKPYDWDTLLAVMWGLLQDNSG
jgi:DNA-binding NtrC family response regulator